MLEDPFVRGTVGDRASIGRKKIITKLAKDLIDLTLIVVEILLYWQLFLRKLLSKYACLFT